MHVANWVGSHVLALITKKGDQNIALITHEVSTDGQTLTVRTSGLIEQVVIFKRSEIIYPDGSQSRTYPDGTRIDVNADGTDWMIFSPDASRLATRHNAAGRLPT